MALPDGLDAFHFHVCPQFLPGCSTMGVPSTGASINVNVLNEAGTTLHHALGSHNPAELKAYLQQHLVSHALPLDEFAAAWARQEWIHPSQVVCNYYHSSKLQAILLGDAAHACSPMIGHGLNIGLEDAWELDKLLDERRDDWARVLPEYSARRVKEGVALTLLSRYASSPSRWQQRMLMASQLIRGTLARHLPALVSPHPLIAIHAGLPLSQAYRELTASGHLAAVRSVKEAARLRHFERSVGLRDHDDDTEPHSWAAALTCWLVLPAAAAVVCVRLLRARAGHSP